MKLQITSLLLLCTALFTSCGSSMHSNMEKWGWTDTNPDPGPKFGDKTPAPAAVATAPAAPAAPAKPPAPAIGTATSHISTGTIPPPPKATDTPEITLPKN